MNYLLLGSLSGTLLGWLMGFLSLFLIMLILIQRGKGGGLTGALGGPGGQSAFGSKAGDTFTVITVVVASIWAFTCAFTMWLLGTHAPPPTSITDTNIKPGPGDTRAAEESTLPPIGGGAPSSPGGIGAAPGETAPGETAAEPSIELTPAESTTTPAAEAAETDSSQDAPEQPAPEQPAAEAPAEPPAP